ncbi:MAG: TRAP transporter fused permease subunit [Defluviitaleaceae bacterium]|nr:TRAP transporter fused permease subunit [Defluviitaleaceae bacterium]
MSEEEKKAVEATAEPLEAIEPDMPPDMLNEAEFKKIMSKYDPAARTRHFEGVPKLIVRWSLVIFALYMLLLNVNPYAMIPQDVISAIQGIPGVNIVFNAMLNALSFLSMQPPQIQRASFAGFVMFFAFMLYPAPSKAGNTRVNHVPITDFLLGIVGAGSFFYFVFFFERITGQMGAITTMDFHMVIIAIIILFIACYRVVGVPLMIVAAVFLAYALFGEHIPGMFGHRGFRMMRIANHSFYQMEGILGVPVGVASTFIFVFLLFGAFVRKTGIGQFFIDISNAIAGRSVGGPAKATVIVSSLQATICGSSVANTVASGSFTIPMMKRLGYDKNFAGAVEASASTGGQLIPPIMGAAAFIMADITGIPFAQIALAASIPALLYFVCVFAAVHFEAKKANLKPMPDEQIPKALPLILQKGYLMLGLLAVVFFLALGFTPTTSAVYSIAICIALSMFRKDTRLTPTKIFEAMEAAARNVISIGVACAMAGVVVGVVTLTGLGITFADAMISMAGIINHEGMRLVAVLFFCMLASLILGLGVPTTAKYVIMATVTAPILIGIGVDDLGNPIIPLLAAHMFVFYFGTDADITPPVALASYAAAAVSRGDPMRTSVIAMKLAIAAYIIPYIFVFNPQMLFINPTFVGISTTLISGIIGIIGIAAAVSGFFVRRVPWYLRVMLILGAILVVDSGMVSDITGAAIIAGIYIWQRFTNKNKNIPALAT